MPFPGLIALPFFHVCLKRNDLLNHNLQTVRLAPSVLSEGFLHLQVGPWYPVKQIRALPPGGAILSSLCGPAQDAPTLSPGRKDTGTAATGNSGGSEMPSFLAMDIILFYAKFGY